MDKPNERPIPTTHSDAADWLLREALDELGEGRDPIATTTRALAHLYAAEGSIPLRIVIRGRRAKPADLMAETSEALEDTPPPHAI